MRSSIEQLNTQGDEQRGAIASYVRSSERYFAMKSVVVSALLSGSVLLGACGDAANSSAEDANAGGPKISFVKDDASLKVDVLVDGKLFTSYRQPLSDSIYKPVLYPINAASGTEITRGYPLQPRDGERNDHRHQAGNWLTYGDVNGTDFWGNGSNGKRNANGGEIKPLSIGELTEGNGEGHMTTTSVWLDSTGKEVLDEKTVFYFIAKDSIRIIDRVATLTAKGEAVSFKDTKEGSFGLRVARQLELPSKEEVTLSDAQGNPTVVKAMNNDGVSGNYRSSEGVQGDAVWSTRAKWMDLYGNIGAENISVVICDHPKNLNYPTFWHARGYGLFSANPFGAKDFTKGKEELNFSLPAGGSLTLRYRIIISSGKHLTDAEINEYQSDFAAKY
ncbi:MAG TPA: PmoA family protein [Flavitalea sp.]|nr:PmoA family protein [Flavitalea sp.]